MAGLAVAIALLLVLSAGPAVALSLAQETGALNLNAWNADATAGSTPGFYLYKGPEAETAVQKPGLMLSGSRTAMLLGGGISLDGGVYFSRTLIPVDPLSVRRSFSPGRAEMLGTLAAAGQQQVLRSGRALWQQFNYGQGKFALTGSYSEVSRDFEGLNDLVAGRPDAEKLKTMLGMKQTSVDFKFQPGARMGLTSHYESLSNDQAGHKEQGLTKTLQRSGLDWSLGSATKLTATRESTTQDWNRPDRTSSEEKTVSTFNLMQTLSRGLTASVTKQLTDTNSSGTSSSLAATMAHLEYKPTGRLNLVADWGDKQPSQGARERTSSVNLSSLLGHGKSAMALTGQWQQKTAGESDAQRDQSLRMGLKMDKNPLMQLAVNYESLTQQGPSAQKDDRKIDATLTSQVGRLGKVVAYLYDQTDAGRRIKHEQKVRFELAPLSRFSFTGGHEQAAAGESADQALDYGQMAWNVTRPLAPWAKETAKTGLLAEAARYGMNGAVAWAQVPDSGLQMRHISRRAMPDNTPSTSMLGFQTMVGRSAYVKLSLQDNPMEMKDNQETLVRVRRDMVETGLRLTRKMTIMARGLREVDLTNNNETQTQMCALRGEPLRRVGLAAGYQQVDGAQQSAVSFVGVNWKARPLANWAQTAASATLFADADKYGWRKAPDWATGEGGLSLQMVAKQAGSAAEQATYLASFQTMLGRSAYLKYAAQQNPFDDKGNVTAARRAMWELGLKAFGKWTVVGRMLHERNLASGLVSQSSALGLRSALSGHERLETTISIDNQSGPGGVDSRSFGLLYARELAADHMLSLKAGFTDSRTGKDDLRWDLAFRKDI